MNRTLLLLGWLFWIGGALGGEIHDAVAKGNVARVQALVAKDPTLVHATDDDARRTPLHVAARAGQVAVAKTLIEAGADLDAADAHGSSPAFVTLFPPGTVEKLVSALAAVSNPQGPLEVPKEGLDNLKKAIQAEDPASRRARMAVLRLLVERGAKIETPADALLHVAAGLGDAEMVEILLEKTNSPNVRDASLCAPLHYAAVTGNVESAVVLLHAKARLDAFNQFGQTPLYLAVGANQLPMVELLLQRGALVDAQQMDGSTPLHVAARTKAVAPAALLLRRH